MSIGDAARCNRQGSLAAALVIATLSLTGFAGAAERSADAEISNFMLDNGMEVVVIPDHRAPIVTHMVWYKAGSADEPPGKSGIAHFFEHLMFKGTKNHPFGEFSAKVAEIGGSENAFTSWDYTAYYQTVLPDALATMMSYESDRMRNLILTDEVVGPERDVILEERRSRIDGSPEALLSEEIDATLFQNQPYRIPVIGWMQEMQQLNRIDATAFYTKYYAPNNAVLVVAGDIDAATVKRLAQETYGKVPRGPDLPPRIRPTEPEQNTKRTVTMRDARVSTASFQKSWVVPSYRTARNGEAEALDLLSEILGGGTRSRIYQQLVVLKGIASSAGASYSGSFLDDTSFSIYGAPRGEAGIEQVESAIDAEIVRIIKDGVTDSELEKAKNRYVRSMIFARDNQAGMANIYGASLTTGGTVADIAAWPDRIKSVTADQIRAVAGKYLNPDRSVAGYLLPPAPVQN